MPSTLAPFYISLAISGRSQEFFEGYRDVAIALLFASAAHWEAVGGRREVTDCNQNSVGFLHNVCVFCFCVEAKTDKSQSIISLATGSAHFLGAANKSLLSRSRKPSK